MSNGLKVKLIALISAGVVGIGSLFSCAYLYLNQDAELIKNQKPYYQIMKDAQSFNADMEVALNKSMFYNLDKYIRLKMDEDKPVIVQYEQNMEEREVNIIKQVIDYYNKVFQTINENYKFEIKEEGYKVKREDTLISFVNVDKPGNVMGESIATDDIKVAEGEWIVNKAQVQLDWEAMKDKEDAYIYGVALHEFSHTIGLGDVYLKDKDVLDRTTVMNVANWGQVNHLYPNDYAILQALYSNEYKKCNDYDEAVSIVKEKIQKYTESFYKYYSKHLKEVGNATDKLQKEQLPETINWKFWAEGKGENLYTLNFNDDNTCELNIMDEKGNVLQCCKGDTMFQDGIMFLRNIVIDDASQYRPTYDFCPGRKLKLMFSIYIDKNNNLVVDNGLGKEYLSTKILNTSEQKITK